MALDQTAAPATEPVSTTEAKAHLRVTHSNDDTYIGTLIKVARRRVEIETGRSLITQSWRLSLDHFPVGRVIKLEKNPISSIASVLYDDADGTEQTFSSTKYVLDNKSTPGRLVLKSSQSWPTVGKDGNAVRITYVTGYGDAEDVPEDLKQAMLLLISHLYANRESVGVGPTANAVELPQGFEWLVMPYRVWMPQ